MESILVLNIISVVVFFIFMFSIVRYTKKNTLRSLTVYAVSSVCICALQIALIIISSHIDKCYVTNVISLCIYVVFSFDAVFSMINRFGKNKK